jgi:1-acyl-sn-glycerol-3-phosphate acyltransferase
VRLYVGRRFESVLLSSAVQPPEADSRPMIVFSNHPSWWDPMLFFLLAGSLYPQRRHFGPMESGGLDKYPVLRRLGVFGVDLDSLAGARKFLAQAGEVLSSPQATLWMTPEGQFVDARERPLVLRPGLARLGRRHPDAVLVPLAIELGFWNESSPCAFLRFGEPVAVRDDESAADLTARCTAALEQTMDALADDVKRRDPQNFEPLIRGRVGVGGVYDVWRRITAAVGGRRADLGHGGLADDREDARVPGDNK